MNDNKTKTPVKSNATKVKSAQPAKKAVPKKIAAKKAAVKKVEDVAPVIPTKRSRGVLDLQGSDTVASTAAKEVPAVATPGKTKGKVRGVASGSHAGDGAVMFEGVICGTNG